MRLLFFQYGDFGAAFRRFQAGEPETYRDQRRSVDYVAGLAPDRTVTVVSICNRPHREDLAPGLISVGISRAEAFSRAPLVRLLEQLDPEMIITRTPNRLLLIWATRRGIPTLPAFADTFANNRIRRAFHNLQLRLALRSPAIPCVANHSLNASLSVVRTLGYPAAKVVPWDWSRLTPRSTAKSWPGQRPWRAFYAGPLSEDKGVGDCLDALQLLKDRGTPLALDCAGAGDVAAWTARAAARGIADEARFLGMIPNTEVRQRMIDADLVLVPSRHGYSEGLPNTIYEALAARTPLLVSDHPAFTGRLQPDRDGLIFRASDPASLAAAVERLMAGSDMYERLSHEAGTAQDRLYIGMEWTRLIETFLSDPGNTTGWVAENSLARVAP